MKEQILKLLYESIKHISADLGLRFTEVMADMLNRYGEENNLQEKEFN